MSNEKHIDLPLTSLIICSRNRPELLRESVLSILNGEELPSELLIMDQSAAEHPQLSRLTNERCTIHYIQTSVVGECPARNQGILMAKHELLVFTDDDVLVTPLWFGTLVRALIQGGPRSVVTGKVLASTSQTPGGFAPVIKDDPAPAVYEGRVHQDILYPMNMAMYRAALAEVGDFDERLGAGGKFRGGEDNDMGYRLLEADYRIHYVPEAVLYHRAWRTVHDYLPLRWDYGYCQGAFYAKHLSMTDRYMLCRMWNDTSLHATRLCRYILIRSRRQSVADALFVGGMLYGAMRWMLAYRILHHDHRWTVARGGPQDVASTREG